MKLSDIAAILADRSTELKNRARVLFGVAVGLMVADWTTPLSRNVIGLGVSLAALGLLYAARRARA